MIRRGNDDAHGLFACEEQILAMHEDGMSRREIAAELNVSVAYIAKILGMFSFESCMGSTLAFEAAARRGSEALLAAIRATGKVHS